MAGRPLEEFIPISYVNANENELVTFLFNMLLVGCILTIVYTMVKGRQQPPKSGGKPASKSDSWFDNMGGMGNMQKAKVNVFGEENKIDVRFKDVAGHENAK